MEPGAQEHAFEDVTQRAGSYDPQPMNTLRRMRPGASPVDIRLHPGTG